jgi:hypothetical protein
MKTVLSEETAELPQKAKDAAKLVTAGTVASRKSSLGSLASADKGKVKTKTWDDAARLVAEGKVKERMAKFKKALKESGDAALRNKTDNRPTASPSRRASAYQQMLEQEKSKLTDKRRDQHLADFEGVDVGSMKEKFKGKSIVETEQAFLHQLQASQQQLRKAHSGSSGPGVSYDISKLKEMFAGGSVAETAEMFHARQAELKQQYQQAQVNNRYLGTLCVYLNHAHSPGQCNSEYARLQKCKPEFRRELLQQHAFRPGSRWHEAAG